MKQYGNKLQQRLNCDYVSGMMNLCTVSVYKNDSLPWFKG